VSWYPDHGIDHALEKIRFRDNVHDDIILRFEDLKAVLEAGRDNERLLRVAYEYALASFEMALRLRMDELQERYEGRTPPDDCSLSNLVEWHVAHHHFESHEFTLHSAVNLRNSLLHPDSASWGGYLFLKIIPRLVEEINDLYDDPVLRRERREECKRVNRHCKRLSTQGAVLDVNGERQLIHESHLLSYENKVNPPTYHFAFWPIYDPDIKPGDSLDDQEPILARCASWDITESGSPSLLTRTGAPIAIVRELSEGERRKMETWKEEIGITPAIMDLAGPEQLRRSLLEQPTLVPPGFVKQLVQVK